MRRTSLYMLALLATFLATFSPPTRAEDTSLARLEASPRHQEWKDLVADTRRIRTFVVYPQRKDSAPAVIVIHENKGLTDWVRGFADQIAEAGYIAIAPDLLSGFSREQKNTSQFASADAAREAIYKLSPEQVISDLKMVRKMSAKLPGSNGKVAVAGFCWGGAKSFAFATEEKDIVAVLTFYGSPPEKEEELRRITAPVYGFYGEDDQRINAQLPATEAAMKKLGKVYEPVIYKGAGHGFMRLGEDPSESEENKKAREDAWVRVKEILGRL